MVRPDQIPERVWHTAMSTYHKTIKKRPGSAWQEAIAAGLAAWQGMQEWSFSDNRGTFPALILPLPQEDSDEPNYAATSGAYCEFDIPKPTPPGGTVVPFSGNTTLDIDADAVLRSPIGTLDTAIVAGIDKDGSEYFASSYGSVADTLFLLERFKKMLLETRDD